jgi:hypothetical protein
MAMQEMTGEQAAELYQSLYEAAQARIETLEAALAKSDAEVRKWHHYAESRELGIGPDVINMDETAERLAAIEKKDKGK